MVHPTCALARHPDSPANGETSTDALPVDLAVLRKRVASHRAAMQEALEAVTCLHDLLANARRQGKDEYVIGLTELRTLIRMIDMEFHRRMEAAIASAIRMEAVQG